MKTKSIILKKQLRKSERATDVDEARFPWLSMLLDTYYIIDTGLKLELDVEEKRRKSSVACHKRCFHCCLHATIPITELEIVGISWFTLEKMDDVTRNVVKEQVKIHKENASCPFLVSHICSIYPMRPIACRIFYVFGPICEEYEDVSKTRPGDIWTHSRDVGREASKAMLPYFGFVTSKEKEKAFEEGFIHTNTKLMHNLLWEVIFGQTNQ